MAIKGHYEMRPQNQVKSIFCFIREKDGKEVAMCLSYENHLLLMVASDTEQVEKLRGLFKISADHNNHSYKLVNFSQRNVVEIYEPNQKDAEKAPWYAIREKWAKAALGGE